MAERSTRFQRVQAELLKHLGEQMEIPAPDIATLGALYKNRRATLFEHQAWSIEFLGVMRFEMTDEPKTLPALRNVVEAGVSGDPLLASARRLLHEHRFVIPGIRRLGSTPGEVTARGPIGVETDSERKRNSRERLSA